MSRPWAWPNAAKRSAWCAKRSRRWSACCRRSRRIPPKKCGRGSATTTALAAAAWPAYDAAVAKADEIVVPVQVNGKVRSRLTVSGGCVGAGARTAGARRSGGEDAYHRKDRQEGRRREGAPRLAGGPMKTQSRWLCNEKGRGAVRRARRPGVARVRLFPGRPRIVSARLHPRRRHSAARQQQHFFQVEQILTEKIRTEFIGRGRYTVVPNVEGADAVVTGAVTSIYGPARRLHRAAAGLPLSLHR